MTLDQSARESKFGGSPTRWLGGHKTEMEEINPQKIRSLEERVWELEEEVLGLRSTLARPLDRLGESVGIKTDRSVTQAAGA